MATSKSPPTVLVLGGTGLAGICLLRELLYRNHPTIAYVRNPSKIPTDLAENLLLTVIKGEMNDHEALSRAMAPATAILSLLGPDIKDRNVSPTLYSDYFLHDIFPLMRKAGIRRIMAMGTPVISRPEDRWTLLQPLVRTLMPLLAGALYKNMMNIQAAFEHEAQGLDWTVFRIANIPGEADEKSWKQDREDYDLFTGPIGGKGWTSTVKRAALARWIVDNMDSWYSQMPAVGHRAK